MENTIDIYRRVSNNHPGITPVALVPAKPRPTEIDVRSGYVVRYFAALPNSAVQEIDKKQYMLIKNNSSYKSVELNWIIKGSVEDTKLELTSVGAISILKGVASKNSAIVSLYNEKLPGLSLVLADPLEYYSGT